MPLDPIPSSRRRPGGRSIPDHILKMFLGPEPGKQRAAKGKSATELKKSRKQPGGQQSPRGGRYMEPTTQEQLEAPVGSMPQPGPTSSGRNVRNELRANRTSRKQGYNVPNLMRDTIDSVGKDKFMAGDFATAADTLGIETKVSPEFEQEYSVLRPKMKQLFWRKMIDNVDQNPEAVLRDVMLRKNDTAEEEEEEE